MRIIDADRFERVLMAMPDDELCEDCCYNVVNKLDEAPTIETEPVVRCKECKWYKEGEHLAPNRFCFRLKDANGKHIGYNFSDNDYCSHGERKDEGREHGD